MSADLEAAPTAFAGPMVEAPSHSQVAIGRNGAVAAGHPLAAAAALDVLRAGGNAVDAAIAGAAVQCVAEMPWCGLGGDGFAIIRTADGDVRCFNGSGVAPLAIVEGLGSRDKVPRHGGLSIGVPGVVDAWTQLASQLGTMTLDRLLAPAINHADAMVADRRLVHAFASVAAEPGCEPIVALGGAVAVGGRFVQADLAKTLRVIAEGGRDAFYRGPIAEAIGAHVQSIGGALAAADLAAHAGEWTAPLSARYRDTTVFVQPPVSMGVLLLVALRLVEQSMPDGLDSDPARLTDFLVRVKHVVFDEALPLLGDPRRVTFDPAKLLADAWLGGHRPLVPGSAGGGNDTTSIAVTDQFGNSVSFIHSLFNEFGSRVLVPGTGVVLNDRLANLRVDPASPNGLEPGKRPMHTLHGYVAIDGAGRVIAGATPGGRGQVQTNLQVLMNILDRGDTIGAAIDRPRWVNGLPRRAPDDDTLYVESTFDPSHAAQLEAWGHRVEHAEDEADDHFGACTIVERDGAECRAAADHRRHGEAVAW